MVTILEAHPVVSRLKRLASCVAPLGPSVLLTLSPSIGRKTGALLRQKNVLLPSGPSGAIKKTGMHYKLLADELTAAPFHLLVESLLPCMMSALLAEVHRYTVA